ncbi:MAG TPA: type II CAAX endopeptidase family protein [Terriglobales bacterium]|nr:type II CAAX endopeptidase family protein [Terriglobales bacterium]
MPDTTSSRKQVITYIALVFLFSSVFYFLILRSGSLRSGMGLYVRGLMWCPALAAFATMKLNHRPLSELGWRWIGNYQWQSWWIPLLYTAIAYVIVWTTGLGAFGNPEFVKQFTEGMNLRAPAWVSVAIGVILLCVFGLLGSLTSALGEEIGWRGFLVPELARTTSFSTTALITGIVWAVWHYPALIWGDYNAGTATWYALICFTALVISASFIFAWMRLQSGSLWSGTMLHASHNLFVQAIFTPLTRNTGKTAWYIDEFGAVLPAVMILFAAYFWRRRKELTQISPAALTASSAEMSVTAGSV